ncbi:MAG TPA: TadE family type IV pilus minor pilin [Aeromicrobium sp.]|nr:TadE family type IV pilus minor pilin [Aeromicrobium sp.]
MVTAELATIAPFAVAFAFLLLWVVSLGLSQVRVTDAAREGARLVARGESTHTATQAAQRLAPDGAEVHIDREGQLVTVRVVATSGPDLPVWSAVGARRVEATSTAVMEDP